NLRNFLLHDTWLYIDKQEEERNYLALHIDILIEITLLCQKKDSYTNSVYFKNTFGTILTISQRLSFSEFPFTNPIFY
ncbi:hypothetical protein Goshw_025243, partial [Gossypium schwendimanii]|nr:hypothetical protein [Gossypium schwendimanii]